MAEHGSHLDRTLTERRIRQLLCVGVAVLLSAVRLWCADGVGKPLRASQSDIVCRAFLRGTGQKWA